MAAANWHQDFLRRVGSVLQTPHATQVLVDQPRFDLDLFFHGYLHRADELPITPTLKIDLTKLALDLHSQMQKEVSMMMSDDVR